MFNRFVVAFFVLLLSSAQVMAELVVDGPWVREAPPRAKALAGYVVLRNSGKESLSLVSLSSPLFEKVEFHVTTFEGGMMRMKQLKQLKIEPGQVEEFEPGGKHLMLINPRKRLKNGDVVPMSVTLEDGSSVDFVMNVRR